MTNSKTLIKTFLCSLLVFSFVSVHSKDKEEEEKINKEINKVLGKILIISGATTDKDKLKTAYQAIQTIHTRLEEGAPAYKTDRLKKN
jgi:aspartate-semialdehyde dehydrogenase